MPFGCISGFLKLARGRRNAGRILATLDHQGHARTALTNHFNKRNEAFCAVSVTFRNPAGAPWDIQFHTAETFELKERYHDVYKRAQDIHLHGASLELRREVTREAWLAFLAISIPPGCDEIDDWQEHSYAHGAGRWFHVSVASTASALRGFLRYAASGEFARTA